MQQTKETIQSALEPIFQTHTFQPAPLIYKPLTKVLRTKAYRTIKYLLKKLRSTSNPTAG